MLALTMLSVPGINSAGRVRLVPCLLMNAISPLKPFSNQAKNAGSASEISAVVMPICENPSENPKALIFSTNAV